MADIFISYARADRDKIEMLAAALEDAGHSVWWDRNISVGAEFSEDIERELNAARAVVVCWSNTANKSRWVRDEASAAAEQDKLIPILLDDERPPMGFRQYQALALAGGAGRFDPDALENLVDVVNARLTGAQAPPLRSKPESGGLDWAKQRTGILAAVAAILTAMVATVIFFAPRSDDGVVQAAAPATPVIAVMPLGAAPADDEAARFADGVREDVIGKLTRLSGVGVIAGRSVNEVAANADSIVVVAKRLGATLVLDGSVRRDGGRINASLQLIDSVTNRQVWSQIYDREATTRNLSDIENDVVDSIANALGLEVDATAQVFAAVETDSLDAYDAYTKGVMKLTYPEHDIRAGLEEALAAFETALAIDPEYAAAFAGRAQAYVVLYRNFRANRSERGQWLIASRTALQKAEFLAPDAVETHFSKGYFHLWGDLNFEQAEAAFDAVLRIAPNFASAYSGKGYAARKNGRFKEAVEAIETAVRLNPLDYSALIDLARTYANYGRFEEARAMLMRAQELSNNPVSITIDRGRILEAEGKADDAYAVFATAAVEPNPGFVYFRAHHALNTKNHDNITAALDAWPEDMKRMPPFPEAYAIMQIKALLLAGEDEAADAALAALVERGAPVIGEGGAWPSFAPYYPVAIPALRGDLDAVRRRIAAYKENYNGDQWIARINHDRAIADALSLAGDADGALDYLERYAGEFGPASYLRLSIDPDLDALHDHPRWLKLRDDYQAWAEENGRI